MDSSPGSDPLLASSSDYGASPYNTQVFTPPGDDSMSSPVYLSSEYENAHMLSSASQMFGADLNPYLNHAGVTTDVGPVSCLNPALLTGSGGLGPNAPLSFAPTVLFPDQVGSDLCMGVCPSEDSVPSSKRKRPIFIEETGELRENQPTNEHDMFIEETELEDLKQKLRVVKKEELLARRKRRAQMKVENDGSCDEGNTKHYVVRVPVNKAISLYNRYWPRPSS